MADDADTVEACSPHKQGLSVTPAQIEAVLRAHAPEAWGPDRHAVSVAAVSAVPLGYNNLTYRVSLSTPPRDESSGGPTCEGAAGSQRGTHESGTAPAVVAVRVSKVSSWPMAKLAGEVASIRLVKTKCPSLPVPDVYFACQPMAGATDAGATGLDGGVAVLCMRWCEGRCLDEQALAAMPPAHQHAVVAQTAEALRAMQHAVPVPAMGCVVGPAPDIARFFDFGGVQAHSNSGPFAHATEYFAELLRLRDEQLTRFIADARRDAARPDCEEVVAAATALLVLLGRVTEVQQRVAADTMAAPLAFTHFDFCGRNMLWSYDDASPSNPEAATADTSHAAPVAAGAPRLTGLVDFEWGCGFLASHDWLEGFDDFPVGMRCMALEEGESCGALPAGCCGIAMIGSDPNACDDAATTAAAAVSAVSPAALRAFHASRWLYRVTDEVVPWRLSMHLTGSDEFTAPGSTVLGSMRDAAVATEALMRMAPQW